MIGSEADPTTTQPPSTPGKPLSKLKRYCYLTVAGVFFVLGAAGAVLPGLPATPFLLLTSYFLIRCSPSLNKRLLDAPLVGPILKDWQQRGGIRSTVRLQAIVLILLVVGLTVLLSKLGTPTKTAICLCAAVGVAIVLRLPAARDEVPRAKSE